MATVLLHGSLTIRDELGVSATFPIFLEGPDTATIADINTAMLAIINSVDALTGGVITEARITEVGVPLGGDIKVAAEAGSRVEQTGLFNFSNSTDPYKFGLDVPALKNSLITIGRINLTDSAVTTFVDLILAGLGSFSAVTNGTNPLTVLADAVLTFRKHRRKLSRSSYEAPG